MKKYINISLILGITLFIGSSGGLFTIQKTGCASGYWGYRSCGTEAVFSSIAILILSLIIIYLSIKSVKSRKDYTIEKGDKKF